MEKTIRGSMSKKNRLTREQILQIPHDLCHKVKFIGGTWDGRIIFLPMISKEFTTILNDRDEVEIYEFCEGNSEYYEVKLVEKI